MAQPEDQTQSQPSLLSALGQAIWQVGKERANQLLELAKLPGDVYAGKVDPLSDEGIGKAFGLAGSLATGGMPLAPEGAAGIFGGRLAKVQPPKSVANPITGGPVPNTSEWFRGIEGAPKFEIPDFEAELKVDPSKEKVNLEGGPSQRFWKLGDVLDHPQLFQAYPHLKDIWYSEDHSLGKYNYGYSQGNLIAVNPNLPNEEKMTTVLHELQHQVQHYEGFATGGNPEDQLFRAQMEVASAVRHMPEPEGTNFIKSIADSFGLNTPEEFWSELANRRYSSLPGEVEARNVEARYSDPALWEQWPPKLTEDTSVGQQRVMLAKQPPRLLTPVDHDPFDFLPPYELQK